MNLWEGQDTALSEARRFCELWGIEGTVLADVDGAVARQLGIRGVPTNVLVDADGTVSAVGCPTPEELESMTLRLLGPGASLDPVEASDWHWQKDPDHIERHVAAWEDPELR